MEGTLCYPLDASGAQQKALSPITSGSSTEGDDKPTDKSGNHRLGILEQAYQMLAHLFGTALTVIRQLRRQIVELRAQAHYWQAQHHRAVQREADLKEDKQHLQAQIRDLQRRLYGRKTETSSAADAKCPAAKLPQQPAGQRRRRGQQPGAPSHGRRNHEHLPAEDESCTLPEEQRCCPYCQEPFEEIPGTADGDILEVEVRGHRRRYHRQRYRRH